MFHWSFLLFSHLIFIPVSQEKRYHYPHLIDEDSDDMGKGSHLGSHSDCLKGLFTTDLKLFYCHSLNGFPQPPSFILDLRPLTSHKILGVRVICIRYLTLHKHTYTQIPISILEQFKCLIDFFQKATYGGTSLVAQWLRICLPMQETQVQALVREDPTCHGATKPVYHNY